ncbi:MAG: glycine--tRNA ligase subunit beta [Magnetococcales bacterium]|nr:glycine--tRNA ligase subunit beta [Magnetococcales bacterium]
MTTSGELLWEIGCEEIPARMLAGALQSFKTLMTNALNEANLAFDSIQTDGTPRRMVVAITGLADAQEASETVRRGPAVKSAFDADGNPTRAAQGFAKGCGVSVEDLQRMETPKGDYLCYQIREEGRTAQDILLEVIPEVFAKLPWPKSQRWGAGDIRFVRPVHRMTVLFNGAVLPVALDEKADPAISALLVTGNQTVGHRFMSPGPFTVTGIEEYRRVLSENKVVLSLDARLNIIRDGVVALAQQADGDAVLDDGLLMESACLVEWPVPLMGSFDEQYLDVPPEVLITSMKNHQKYFPVRGRDGKLLPKFILVSNMVTRDDSVLIRGNERVLRARLEDAAFYWKVDSKTDLASRLPGLDDVVFQVKLGSVGAKSRRIEALAGWLAEKMAPDAVEIAKKAGQLCKCDLVSGMVGEFPELQGIMGAYYAQASGLGEKVADAIRHHYQPQGASDDLPTSDGAVMVSMADKLDTLVGCFSIGLEPTGNKDPFALRRSALGIIRLILDRGAALSLSAAINQTYGAYDASVPERSLQETRKRVLDFFYGRLKNHLKADGLDYDLIDAVQALDLDDLADVVSRIRALDAFRQLPEYESLVAANKRVANILSKSAMDLDALSVAEDLLKDSEEKALFEAVTANADTVAKRTADGDYSGALTALVALRPVIDQFFEKVLVMDPDPAIQKNRLALLALMRTLFHRVADVSRLVLGDSKQTS